MSIAASNRHKSFAALADVSEHLRNRAHAAMMVYRLYCLDEVQRIISARAVVARDDLEALTEAEKFSEMNAIEVWQGARCVARVKKGNAALDASDRMSL